MIIPKELVEQIERNNVVLILGHDINLGEPGERRVPTRTDLARELASRSGYSDHDLGLARVAQHYEMKFGRSSLVSYVSERLQDSARSPLAAHRILSRLPFRVIITTCFDNRMEWALHEAGRPYVAVIQNADFSYEDEDKFLIVKIYGELDQPDSLILTEMDHRRFLSGLFTISDALNRLVASRTLLFLGPDLDDIYFKDLCDMVDRRLDRHAQRSYAFYLEASSYAVDWWEKLNDVQVTQANPTAFLRHLEDLLLESRTKPSKPVSFVAEPAEKPIEPIPRRPYKFLNAYRQKDAAFFFGRDRETQKLLSKIVSYRLVLLYGKSGVGKTSLIQAGIMPALTLRGYRPVYARVLTDPRTTIIQAVNATLQTPLLEQQLPAKAETSDEILERTLDQKHRIKLRQVLTTLFDEGDLRTLCFDLGVDYDSLPGRGKDNKARDLIAYLERRHQIDELVKAGGDFRPDIPWSDILQLPERVVPEQTLGLQACLRQACKATKSLLILFLDQFEELFTQVDPETRAAFIQDLGAVYAEGELRLKIVLSFREDFLAELNAFTNDIPDIYQNYYRLKQLTLEQAKKAIILPAQMCGFNYERGLIDRLLNDLGDDTIDPPQLQIVCDSLYEGLGPNEKLITNRHYEQLGGARVILTGYLDQVLKRYGSKQRVIIQGLLKAFVTSADTGGVLTDDSLAHRARLPVEQVRTALDELLQARLVRRAESESQYELAHEYLLHRIISWISDQDRAQQRAQEMLEQGIMKWRRFGLPLYRDEMAIVDAQLEALEIRDDAEVLMVHSAVWAGRNTDYWMERASPALRAIVLSAAIKNEEIELRQRAVALAGRFKVPNLEITLADLMLNDHEPAIRREAAVSLACVDAGRFSSHLLEVLSGPPERHERALGAIANVQDARPNGIDLDQLMRFGLRWRLSRVRLKRNRVRRNLITGYSVLGGGIGGMLGGTVGVVLSGLGTVMAVMVAAGIGIAVGMGVGFGFGTVEAIGERRNSLLYPVAAAIGGGITTGIFGLGDEQLSGSVLGASLGLVGGIASGGSVAVIVNLTLGITKRLQRMGIRFVLSAIMGAITLGSVLAYGTERQVIPVGPLYAVCVSLGAQSGIAIGLDFAERALYNGHQ